jgi:homocysteine S-methyltransferase
VTSLPEALAVGPVALDGGLATTLEQRGHDLSGALWSARLLVEAPSAVAAVHREFAVAGAQVVTTASYQLSADGLTRAGLDPRDLSALLSRSVELARGAVADRPGGRPRWVAGSVGPYGAALADGSEYRGDYGLSVDALRGWHRPRIAALVEAGPDLLALETLPCLAELEALLAEVAGTGVPCWVSLTAVRGPDGSLRTRCDEPLREAFAMAAEVSEVVAAGVNCCDPALVTDAVALAHDASGRPAVAYPNAGESWDAVRRTWTGESDFRAADAPAWVAAGARLVGGCCRVGISEIAEVAALLR